MHAAFASETSFSKDQQDKLYKFSDKTFKCSISGNGLMARKDNKIISTWNIAFSKLQEGSAFKDYCTAANDKHGEFLSARSSLK